jgi:putative sterol carrier protein
VRVGPAGTRVVADDTGDDADLVLLTDYPTARALHEGRVRAQDALATGLLKVQGRPEVLAKRADLLARLDAAFAPVRAGTTFPDGQ